MWLWVLRSSDEELDTARATLLSSAFAMTMTSVGYFNLLISQHRVQGAVRCLHARLDSWLEKLGNRVQLSLIVRKSSHTPRFTPSGAVRNKPILRTSVLDRLLWEVLHHQEAGPQITAIVEAQSKINTYGRADAQNAKVVQDTKILVVRTLHTRSLNFPLIVSSFHGSLKSATRPW